MYKISRFLRRIPGSRPEHFPSYWRNEYGGAWAAVAALVEGLLGYAQNHRAPTESPIENAPAGEYDGVDEFWFESAEAAHAFFPGELFLSRLAALEAKLFDREKSAVTAGQVHRLWERPAARKPDAVKVIIQPVRKASLTHEEFVHHWIYVHSPLSLQGPNMRQNVQRVEFCPSDGKSYCGLKLAACEGTGAIWFDSAAGLRAEFESEYYRTTLAPDEKRFTDSARSRAMMTQEHMAWPLDGLLP